MVGGPQKFVKSPTGVAAWFVEVFCPIPSNTGNPMPVTAGLRSMSGPNVLALIFEVRIRQEVLSVGAVESKARKTPWSFTWLAAPSTIPSVFGDGGVHAGPTVPLAGFERVEVEANALRAKSPYRPTSAPQMPPPIGQ